MSSYLSLYALLGASSFVTCVCLTAILIRIAPALGLIDEPAGSKFHRVATPVGGGLAMYAALLPVLLAPATRSTATLVVVLASGLVALVGLVDDFRHVPAPVKFLALIGMTLLLWAFGVGATTTRQPVADFLITVLWVTGVSSAFNALDNMDGLATGAAAIAAATFLIIACQTGQWILGGLSAALLGSSLGFLVFNFPPARIFMGDAGSFFLGFLLASLGVVGEWNSNEVIAAIIPILVLGLPIFDLSFTVLRRHWTGVTRSPIEALKHCDTDHLSHRLVRLGLPPRTAVLLLYLLAVSFGISAVTLRDAASTVALLHLVQALVITAALIPILCLADGGAGPGVDVAAGRRREGRAAWLVLPLLAVLAAFLLG